MTSNSDNVITLASTYYPNNYSPSQKHLEHAPVDDNSRSFNLKFRGEIRQRASLLEQIKLFAQTVYQENLSSHFYPKSNVVLQFD